MTGTETIEATRPELSSGDRAVIERAEAVGRGLIAERATAVDRGTLSVRDTLHRLAEAGLAGLTIPRAFGGLGAGRVLESRVLEALAYGDGTTPFTIAQHFGTGRMLTHSSNEELRRAVLPELAAGRLFAGFGISQVRRAGAPVLAATPSGSGYRFDGAIPWMTGLGLFDYVVIAGTLPDGRDVLAWVPFVESEHLHLSAPMELVAMNGARTISATIEGLTVTADQVVTVAVSTLRGRPSTTPVPCLFGVIRACLADLDAVATRRNAPATAAAARTLEVRLEQLRRAFYSLLRTTRSDEEGVATLEELRAAVTQLAFDSATTLIVATSGGANALTNAAQRRLRECAIFATWGLSTGAIERAVGVLSREA